MAKQPVDDFRARCESLIRSDFGDGPEGDTAVDVLTRACEAARVFPWGRWDAWREQTKTSADNVIAARGHALAVAEYLQDTARVNGEAVMGAVIEAGAALMSDADFRHVVRGDRDSVHIRGANVAFLLAKILDAIARGPLWERLPDWERLGIKIRRRFIFGPAEFPVPLDARKAGTRYYPRPDKLTVHLAFLVYLCRAVDGSPHYDLTADLTALTFDRRMPRGDATRKRVDKLHKSFPDMIFVGYR